MIWFIHSAKPHEKTLCVKLSSVFRQENVLQNQVYTTILRTASMNDGLMYRLLCSFQLMDQCLFVQLLD